MVSKSFGSRHLVAAAIVTMMMMSPAFAGAPFVTDDADTPDAKHFEINLTAEYTRFQGGSGGILPGLEINYGITNKLQISIQVQQAFAHADGIGTNFGYGDTVIGLKYRFIEADDWGWRPAVAFAPQISLPSGSEARGLGSGQIGGSLPVWVSKDFNQWTVFGGGGYNINPGIDRRNWWFAGIGVTRELTPQWTVGVELYHTTRADNDAKDNTAFNIGVIYNLSDTHHLMAAIGRNLINARENNELSVFLGYQLTF